MEYDIGGLVGTEESHEALVVSHGDLGQALFQDALISASRSQVNVQVVELVGALDSACNRTCCGPAWLAKYRAALDEAPDFVKNLVESVSECEAFRFGNGSSTPSYARWRLPALLDGKLFLFWVSVVDIPSLGLLMGRDCMEALGIRLDFERKLLDCRRLGVGKGKARTASTVAAKAIRALLERAIELERGALPPFVAIFRPALLTQRRRPPP